NSDAAMSISEVLGSTVISALRTQESEIARNEAKRAEILGEKHPRLLEARAQLKTIRSKIGGEISKVHRGLSLEVIASKAKEMSLQSQLDKFTNQSGGQGQSAAELSRLMGEAESNKHIYQTFLDRSKELREQQDLMVPDARVLSQASAPSSPSSPHYVFILAVSFIGGLGIAALVVLAVERMDSGFRASGQFEDDTGLSALGMVPLLTGAVLGQRSPIQYLDEQATSSYGEALRSIYTSTMLSNLDAPPKVFMITSSVPSEGKSTFSASLAMLLTKSSSEKRVIVVDCDLRHPSVGNLLGGHGDGHTLDQYLSGEAELKDVIRISAGGVYYVCARRNTPNAADILSSRAMKTFVEMLVANFDIVILDTPPVMAVADPLIVGRLADYIIYLVQWQGTPRELVLNSLKILRGIHKNIGGVLSQVNVKRHSQYGYGDVGHYYSKYNKYYNS
ncbi:MAG: GNVR domain-containing protein, partial [Rhodospirillaceae bacterium]